MSVFRPHATWNAANISLGDDPHCKPEASDFLATLLRDATSSHLLETLVTKSSPQIFNLLWSTYIQHQLPRLSVHPVANFVVSRALARVDQAQLGRVCEDLGKSWQKIISRVPILRVGREKADIYLRRIFEGGCHEGIGGQGGGPGIPRRRHSRGMPSI